MTDGSLEWWKLDPHRQRVETNKQIKARNKAPWNVNQGWVKGSKDGEQKGQKPEISLGTSWEIKPERTGVKFGFKYQVNRCWRSF